MSLDKDYFENETFTKYSLLKGNLERKEFQGCQFVGCSFIECKFRNCKFIECNFIECVLSAVNPVDSRFRDVKFLKCKVIGIDWTKALEVSDLKFDESQINYSNFSMLKIPSTRMVKCIAKEVNFTETDLSKGDFRNSDFEKSRFFKTNLSEADFRGATSYNIDIKNNLINQAKFSLPEAVVLLNSLNIIIE
jgi:fluoroquinolone resistance protein